jgi:DNA-directed RNA polymerase subunit L
LLTGSIYFFTSKKEESSKEVIVSLEDYVLGNFLNELPEINKKLPHIIDNQTTLLSIKYDSGKIISIYELVAYKISREFLDKIKPSIKNQACDDGMKKNLLAVDVELLDRYQNSTGDILFEIALSKSICSEL